jgi:hypothetical protein
VTLRYFERTPVVVVSDVLDHVAELHSDGARPSLELAEIGFAPHRCLQIVPPANGKVTITVPMQLGTKLVGYVGLADVFKRRAIRTPGELEIHAGTATTSARSLSPTARVAPAAGPKTSRAASGHASSADTRAMSRSRPSFLSARSIAPPIGLIR